MEIKELLKYIKGTYRDLYSDVLTWRYGISLVRAKADLQLNQLF